MTNPFTKFYWSMYGAYLLGVLVGHNWNWPMVITGAIAMGIVPLSLERWVHS